MRALSRASVLALHALHLLLRQSRPVTARELRRSSGCSAEAAHEVLSKLRRQGYIRNQTRLGYVLAKAPGEISLQELITLVDRPEAPKAPCGGDYDACDTRASCLLAPICRRVETSLRETLQSITLADLETLAPGIPNCLDTTLLPEAS